MKPGSLADRLSAILFPKRCVLCDEPVEYDDTVCARCAVPRVEQPIAIHPMFRDTVTCVGASLYYKENAKEAMIRLKRNKKPDMRTVFFFTDEMWQVLQKTKHVSFDCMTAVPQSSQQKLQRPFNPPSLLADRLSQISGIPCIHDVLTRSDDSQVQHGLSRSGRLQNAIASYHSDAPEQFAGRSVLLIDDIYTTGATCFACARQIMLGNAQKVCVLTAMYTRSIHAE